jgi:hypothetical protein
MLGHPIVCAEMLVIVRGYLQCALGKKQRLGRIGRPLDRSGKGSAFSQLSAHFFFLFFEHDRPASETQDEDGQRNRGVAQPHLTTLCAARLNEAEMEFGRKRFLALACFKSDRP